LSQIGTYTVLNLNAGWSAELALIMTIQGLYLSNSSASSLSQCKAISKRLQHWIYSSNTPAERALSFNGCPDDGIMRPGPF